MLLNIAEDDPIRAVWAWRNDSQTLARLRPVLERMRTVPDLPCMVGKEPFDCMGLLNGGLCPSCVIRDIKIALFGAEQPERGSNGPATTTDGPDRPGDD